MSLLQSLSQSRVVDPVLTSMQIGVPVQGYIAQWISPMVYCPKRQVRVIRHSTSRDKTLYTLRRAPGSDIARVVPTFGDDVITLYQDAIEAMIPLEHIEESMDVVDLQLMAIRLAKNILATRLEFDVFSLVNAIASYPASNRLLLTAATQFSTAGVDPNVAIDAMRAAVLAGINRPPNTIVFGGARAFNATRNNAVIRNQLQYTSSQSIDIDILGQMLGFTTALISTANYTNPNDPSAAPVPFFDNSIWIGYVPGNGEAQVPTNKYDTSLDVIDGTDQAIPSFAYTYVLDQARFAGRRTGVIMTAPYEDRGKQSIIYPALIDRAPVLTGLAGGALIQNVAA